MRPMLFAVLLALAAPGALAQTMFKCVGIGGKISYIDQPCAGKVAARKEIDVRANLDDVARAERKKQDLLLRQQEDAQSASAGADEQARNREKEIKLKEGSELDRSLAQYEQMRQATQQRVKADEEARAEASRLWNCRRGPAPEKCQ